MKLPLNQGRDRRYLSFMTDYLWTVNYYEGKYHLALACLAVKPGDDIRAHWTRWMQKGMTYVALNERVSAKACFDTALSYAERETSRYRRAFHAGITLAWRGDQEKAALNLEEAGRRAAGYWTGRRDVEEEQARAALLGGDNERALDLIERLLPQPGFMTVWDLRLDPVYNPLRSNPRFLALLEKYGRM
jgi:hypothetical protein